MDDKTTSDGSIHDVLIRSTIECPIERKVNIWSKFMREFGVPTAILSAFVLLVSGAVSWYAVSIYKPDQEAERIDRRLNAESAAKVATAVDNQTGLMQTISHGLDSLGVELRAGLALQREGQQLQRETHSLLKEQKPILEELVSEQKETNAKLDRPLTTKPMTDGGRK